MEDERMQRRSHVAPEAAEEELRLLVAAGAVMDGPPRTI